MPPTLYLVRHAQGENNIEDSHWIRDAVLTEKGKEQSLALRQDFPHHDDISLVISSPLRRAIQTASIAFSPTIARSEVQYLVHPLAQEINSKQCDIGYDRADIQNQLPDLLPGKDLGFALSKIDLSLVHEGWNSKTGIYAPDREAVKRRAASLRSWLFQRSEDKIVLVTHGAFLHFLTEDWTGDDPVRGTAYLNCEVRIFDFTDHSTAADAHIEERNENRANRVRRPENDAEVVAEMAAVGVKVK